MTVKVRKIRGKWYIVAHWKRQRLMQVVGDSLEEARKYQREIQKEIRLQGASVLDRMKNKARVGITMAGYAEKWMEELEQSGLKLSTVNSYKSNLRHYIIPWFGGLQVSDLNYGLIKDFISDVRLRKSPRTGKPYSRDSIRIMVATLRAMLDEALREGLIDVNPCYKLGKLYGGAKTLREEPDPFSLEELHKVEAICRDRWPEYYDFTLCLGRTGMRIGEALALKIQDVDFMEETIRIRRNLPIHGRIETPKTAGSRRTIKIDSPELTTALEEMIRRRREIWLAKGETEIPEWLFCNSRGNPLDRSNWTKVWNRMQRLAKVQQRRPHDLRHTYATLMLLMGKPLPYVSKQLGHASPRITLEIYSHWIRDADSGEKGVLDVTSSSSAAKNRRHTAMEESE